MLVFHKAFMYIFLHKDAAMDECFFKKDAREDTKILLCFPLLKVDQRFGCFPDIHGFFHFQGINYQKGGPKKLLGTKKMWLLVSGPRATSYK